MKRKVGRPRGTSYRITRDRLSMIKILYFDYKKKPEEIAHIVNISIRTVESYIAKIKNS